MLGHTCCNAMENIATTCLPIFVAIFQNAIFKFHLFIQLRPSDYNSENKSLRKPKRGAPINKVPRIIIPIFLRMICLVTVFCNRHHFWVVSVVWKFRIDSFTLNWLVFQFTSFSTKWARIPPDNDKLALVNNNTMTPSTLVQFTKPFPLFRGCIERGDNIWKTTGVTAKSVERAFKCNDREIIKVWALTEYFWNSFWKKFE